MTSRAEYRLLLRHDNADLRLTEVGHQIGLVEEPQYQAYLTKKTAVEEEIQRLKKVRIKPTPICSNFPQRERNRSIKRWCSSK